MLMARYEFTIYQLIQKSLRPVNSHTSVRHYKFGEMTRLIFACLKHSAGLYRKSSEITAFIISHLDYPVSSEEKIIIRESVGKRLRRLRVQGKVIEVPQTKNTSDKHWKLSNWTELSTLWRPKILKPSTTPYPDDGLDDTHATNEIARF
ncbi:MAG: hypothetical protein H0W85_01930 [Methylotenera sp.]|nr:hypothetical protein [Methylotenera sp.]